MAPRRGKAPRPPTRKRRLLRRSLSRLAAGVAVVFGVTTTVFVVTRMTGDPVRRLLPVGASPQAQHALRAALHLDDPVWTQYTKFLGDLAHLNFGDSLWQHTASLPLALGRLPASLELVTAGLGLSLVVFVPLGLISSLRPGSRLDRCVVALTLVGVSVPEFWVGAILILVFAVNLGWLPTSGSGSARHLVLPAVVLAIGVGARLAQITRSAAVEQLTSPYIVGLRSRGLTTSRIITRHVLRNILLPVLTVFFWEFGLILGSGAIVVENVFSYPGVGQLLVQAADREDIFLMQAIVFVGAIIVVVANIIADTLYTIVDPRVDAT